jgi:cell division protease FtsH
LAAAVQEDAKPVQKISIIPRTKGALGYVLTAPEEEKFTSTKTEMLAEIIVFMAGRAAEEIKFNTQTTGASSDIEKATRMARSMVSMYGMSEKFGMMGLESIQNRYLDGRPILQVSDRTGAEIDMEVRGIIDECYKKAIEILKENESKMDEIAEFLFSKETITGEEFAEMFERKGDVEEL